MLKSVAAMLRAVFIGVGKVCSVSNQWKNLSYSLIRISNRVGVLARIELQ